jgi:hypothetical protein
MLEIWKVIFFATANYHFRAIRNAKRNDNDNVRYYGVPGSDSVQGQEV